jgi:5'-methylthioadenosine phosphorylase
VLEAARGAAWEPVDGGTLVVIEGPRFSTRAESRWFTANGWSVVGMTGHPEAVLARELGLCYTSVALVTDHDAGVEAGEGVTQAEVLKVFAGSVDRLRTVLFKAIGMLPTDRACVCSHALDGLTTGLPGD